MKMNPRHLARTILYCLLFAAASEAFVPAALAQSFTLTPSFISPPNGTVNVGGTAVGSLTVASTGGFDSTVNLACTVSSNTVTANLPACVISPVSVTPSPTVSDTASITITTCGGVTSTCTGPTPTGVYTIAITGTSGSIIVNAALSLNVVGATAEDYALAVLPTTATPSPINPGNSATTTVTVSGIGSYSGTVTVACLSVEPAVEAEPYCTFNPPTVTVPSGGPAPTTTLTITTLGPTPTVTEVFHLPRAFYAMFLAFPGIVIMGAAGSRKRRTRFVAFILLVSAAASLALLPACSQNNTNNAQGLTTPKNTYTFTLTATDSNGNGPANSTSPATVTLTVN